MPGLQFDTSGHLNWRVIGTTLVRWGCVGVVSVALSGCAALVIGGGGAGQGDYGGSSSAPAPGELANDANLTNAVKAELIRSESVQAWAITVDVRNGTATLDGTVSSATQRGEAERIARAVDGIRTVTNNLRIVLEP